MTNPTLNAVSLKAVLEQAATDFLTKHAGINPAKPKAKARPNAAEYDAAVIREFKKAGFADPKPRENIKTYNLWLGAGYKVRAGEKSIKIKQFRLFHRSQVEALNAEVPAVKPKSGKAVKAIKAAKAGAAA